MTVKAAIDIGTNSVRLLAVERQGGKLMPVCRELITTRLGEGVHHSKLLSQPAMERTAAAVSRLAQMACQCGAANIQAVATSAVRDALNRQVFLDLCQQAAGLDIQVLSGIAEAQLSFAGAVREAAGSGTKLVVDIGGGSTELAFGEGRQLHQAVSLNLGAVRLNDLFPPAGDGRVATLEQVKEYIRQVLPQAVAVQAATELIGVGGTTTSLAAVIQQLTVYDSDKVHGFFLSAREVKALVAKLAGQTLAERKQLAGLQPQRADIIVYGASILDCLLDWYEAEGVTVSEHDILQGIVNQM